MLLTISSANARDREMNQRRYVALILAIVAPALIGGWLGWHWWHYPYFSFPVLSYLSYQDTTADR
jgi:multidrug resistance efflux pump